MWKKLRKDNRGQAMAEYGLLIALIVVGLIVVVTAFRGQLVTMFTNATTQLTNAK